jgi:hypothetical protein
MHVSHYLRLGGLLFAAALLLPAATKSENRSCVLGTPTAASYTWNFPSEAQGLLNDIATDAREARVHSDRLDRFASDPDLSWQSHAVELSAIRDAVNDMGSKLCRLETIRRVALPWEKKAIDDAAPLISEMANEAQAAITFLNDHQQDLFSPAYNGFTAGLYQRSVKLSNDMNEFEKFSRVHQEDIQLEKSLGFIKRG